MAVPVVEQGLHAPAVAVPPVVGVRRLEQHQQLGVAPGRIQAGQAGDGAGIPAMALRAWRPGGAQARQQLVGPGRGHLGAAAQGAPVVAESLDPRHLVVDHGLPKALQPGLPGLRRHLDGADQGHELLEDVADDRLQAAGGVIDVLEGRRELLDETHGPVGGHDRVFSDHGPDLGGGLVEALDGPIGLPAKSAAAEAGGEGPGGGGPWGPVRGHARLYSVGPGRPEKTWHSQGTDLSQGVWRAWRDSNPRPMASEAVKAQLWQWIADGPRWSRAATAGVSRRKPSGAGSSIDAY